MTGIWEMNAWALIKAGGPIMVPILICSILALGIILEKLIHFASIRMNNQSVKQHIFEQIKNNKIKEATNINE